MMLTLLVLTGLVIYLLFESPKNRKSWHGILTGIGIALILVGGYNMALAGGWTGLNQNFSGPCLYGGGLWPGGLLSLLGLALAVTGINGLRRANASSETRSDDPAPGM